MDFEINDDRIDVAHRLILQIIDSFAALPKDAEEETVVRLIERLREHATDHFAEEEHIMEDELRMDADYLTAHRRDHNRLRDMVTQASDAVARDGVSGAERILAELREAVKKHIFTLDAQMAEPVARLQKGGS